jgi:predicted aspartyl protease
MYMDSAYLLKVAGTIGIVLGVSSCGGLPEAINFNASEASPTTTEPASPVNPANATDPSEPADQTPAPSESTDPMTEPVAPTATPPSIQADYFREAVNRASSAVAIGQSAQSPDDWNLAKVRWQQAVELLEQVPATSPSYDQAQTKIAEYRTHLAAAQQRAEGRPVATATESEPANGLVAQIPIAERRGGTPVVSVTMTGQKGSTTFPMLFDTGATGTLITQDMADALGVVVVDETQARIADGSIVTLPIGYVTAIEAGGLRKEGILVAIGGSVGLLGQDFYGEYGIAMGAQVINLHQ